MFLGSVNKRARMGYVRRLTKQRIRRIQIEQWIGSSYFVRQMTINTRKKS